MGGNALMSLDDERRRRVEAFISQVRGQLIVSCQALVHEPLYGAEIMMRMALAAMEGGAAAIRANTPVDIAAIRKAVSLPIIGLYKEDIPGYPVYITPSLHHALAVAEAGADVVAIDATARPRPEPGSLADFIERIHMQSGLPVLADISTLAEGIAAVEAGADLVSTTMSGYTADSLTQRDPDLELVGELSRAVSVPVLAEGRYRTPQQASDALAVGALAVVVGGAITRPQEITRSFVEELHHAASRVG
jgi:N-acylglucosamine-6-phosphate 2-epimerase